MDRGIKAWDGDAQHLEVPSTDKKHAETVNKIESAGYEAKRPMKQVISEGRAALGWCAYSLVLCIMLGYDALAGAIVIALPQFRAAYGTPFGQQYVISAAWQLGFTGAGMVGIIIGSFLAKFMVQRFGRAKSYALASVITIGGTAAEFWAPNLGVFTLGKALNGVPFGIYQTCGAQYCSEVAPAELRGTLTALMNWMTQFGQFLAYAIMDGTSRLPSSYSYRILFAIQWAFAVGGLLPLYWYPESPYWLLDHGKEDEAHAVVERLYKNIQVDAKINDIKADLKRDGADQTAQVGLLQAFNGEHRYRTWIVILVALISTMSGAAWVISYVTYFFQLAGMPVSQSFNASLGVAALAVVGNFVGSLSMLRVGRRTLLLYGMAILGFDLLIIGILACIKSNNALWAQVAFMCLWSFVFACTLGIIPWPIAAEVPSSNARTATLSIAVIANYLGYAIWAFSLPYAVNPDEGNLQGKIGFIFAAILVILLPIGYCFVPETKDRSFSDINELFARGIAPRHFHRTVI